MADMPSSSPVKPSFSSVVALTDICEISLPHGDDIGGKLWLLCADGGVYIAYFPAFFGHNAYDFFHELHTVCTLIVGVVIWEKLADIAQCLCTMYGIHYGVGKDVCIGMS